MLASVTSSFACCSQGKDVPLALRSFFFSPSESYISNLLGVALSPELSRKRLIPKGPGQRSTELGLGRGAAATRCHPLLAASTRHPSACIKR